MGILSSFSKDKIYIKKNKYEIVYDRKSFLNRNFNRSLATRHF